MGSDVGRGNDAGCLACRGTGEGDPFEVHAGAPLFTDCRACLGAGLAGCDECDGDGIVPVPVSCPVCAESEAADAA